MKKLMLPATLLLTASAATAQVTPITPDAFGPQAVTETFEGVLVVSIPQVALGGQTVNWGVVPTGYAFPTGVRLVAQSPPPDEVLLFDYGPPSQLQGGYGLGIAGGSVDANTPLPSGTAFLACSNFTNDMPMTFRLPVTAFKVGCFVETGGNIAAVIKLFDDTGTQLGTHAVTTNGVVNDGLDTWIGVESTVPIRTILIDPGSGVIDDLTFDPCAGAAVPYGQGCPGAGNIVPALAMKGCPEAGGQISLEISNGLGGSTALLLFGLNQGSTPIGASGCDLLVAPLIGPVLALPLTPGGPGQGSIFLPGKLPAGSTGVSFTTQAWVIDPVPLSGAAASNGLKVTIG